MLRTAVRALVANAGREDTAALLMEMGETLCNSGVIAHRKLYNTDRFMLRWKMGFNDSPIRLAARVMRFDTMRIARALNVAREWLAFGNE